MQILSVSHLGIAAIYNSLTGNQCLLEQDLNLTCFYETLSLRMILTHITFPGVIIRSSTTGIKVRKMHRLKSCEVLAPPLPSLFALTPILSSTLLSPAIFFLTYHSKGEGVVFKSFPSFA